MPAGNLQNRLRRLRKSVILAKTKKSAVFTRHEGQTAKIIGTDDKEWRLIKTQSGKQGWFAVRDFVTVRNDGRQASEVFAGLCYAN